jgi:hypothetical protein
MKTVYFFLLLIFSFDTYSQNSKAFVETLETDIIFNEYLTKEIKVKKLNQILDEVIQSNFDEKDIILKYTQVNLLLTKAGEDKDQALYQFVELTEICDTTNQIGLKIYLGSLLQISSVLRENNAFELSYKYIEKGINIIERNNLKNYSQIQGFYNDAGVDLLSMSDYNRSLTALKKALSTGENKNYLQDAMIEYNLSFLYYELGNIDSAIFHQNNTCSYFEKIENLVSYPELNERYASSLGSLSIFYYSNNNYDKAQSTALKAKLVYKKIDIFNSGRYPHLFTLINLAINNKNEAQIEIIFKEIKNVSSKVEKGKYSFYLLLSNAYKEMGNSTQENNYLVLAYDQLQTEYANTVNKLQIFNSKLQAQILQREQVRFLNEKKELSRKALLNTSIISLILIFFIAILYILYVRTKNKKDLLEKERKISKIEIEKNEIKTKLTESELSEKRMIANRLASHIKLKQQTETAFLQKIKELKRSNTQNIEAEISELQVKMMNLISIDRNFEYNLHVDDINQEFKEKLRNNHPELSNKEMQFCAYLLLGLTTKEIGSITNQTDGAIRVYKTRLKNKLIGDLDTDLTTYLQKI